MKNLLKNAVKFSVIPLFVFGVAGLVSLAPVSSVSANDTREGNGISKGLKATEQAAKKTGAESVDNIVQNVINALLYVIGIASVIMLIYGGIRYTTSGGSSDVVTKAKNTIMYAIIGLVIAMLAYAIVNWVVTDLFK